MRGGGWKRGGEPKATVPSNNSGPSNNSFVRKVYVLSPLRRVPSNPLTKNVRGKRFEDIFFHMDSQNCSRVRHPRTIILEWFRIDLDRIYPCIRLVSRRSKWYGGTVPVIINPFDDSDHSDATVNRKTWIMFYIYRISNFMLCYCSRVRGNRVRHPRISSVNTHGIVRGYAYRCSTILDCSRIRNCSREQ